MRGRTLVTQSRPNLLVPNQSNRTALYCWKPGYYYYTETETSSEKPQFNRVFKPTSTVEAALAYFIDKYGQNDYLRFKEDIHPGHVSIGTQKKHLSIGTLDDLGDLGISSSHSLYYSDSLAKDVIGSKRAPEIVTDFYTLNVSEINSAIDEFLNSKKVYSLLGNRLNLADGESCATACYIVLSAGGIDELLYTFHNLISRNSILTPSLLASFAEAAKEKERSNNPKIKTYSEAFFNEHNKEMQILLEKINVLDSLNKDDELSHRQTRSNFKS